MGCNATSIYGDEVIGKIFYPDQILNDLRKRDFCQAYQIKDKKHIKQISQEILSIYGFSQSFCQAFIFSTLIDQNQFLVYNNGRFIIKILKNQLFELQSPNHEPRMSILPHEDEICAMDVNQNMCVVGLSGGKLILWDLKFNEIKIEINLPKPSSSFSSISLTKKYIFVTDTNLPKNIAYCFDIQTTKLKSSGLIDSLEPTLKGIRFQENHHVTISAEGLWFVKYSTTGKILELTKGMFTTFPKTSQCSITAINDKYLVSGGVDGYIYVWNSLYQCIKVIKCFEQQKPITAIAYSKAHNTLILGSLSGKIKCFSFCIKHKPNKKNQEPNQGDYMQMEQDIEYLLTQALDEEFGIQNLVSSQEDTLLYLALHCRGSMLSHLLPSTEPYPTKLNNLNNQQLMRFSRKGDVVFSTRTRCNKQSKQVKRDVYMANAYPSRFNQFNVDILIATGNMKWFKVQQRSLIKTKDINRVYLNFYCYCRTNNSIAYVSENFVVVDFQPIKTEGLSLREELEAKNKQALQNKTLKILELYPHNVLISLNYLQIQNLQKIYLFVTFEDESNVFQVQNKNQYLLHTSVKFLKNKFNHFTIHSQPQQTHTNNLKINFEVQMNLQVQINLQEPQQRKSNIEQINFEVFFDDQLKIWKLSKPIHQNNIQTQIVQGTDLQKTQISIQQLPTIQKVHCSYLKGRLEYEKSKITIGGSSVIFWDLKNNQVLKNNSSK